MSPPSFLSGTRSTWAKRRGSDALATCPRQFGPLILLSHPASYEQKNLFAQSPKGEQDSGGRANVLTSRPAAKGRSDDVRRRGAITASHVCRAADILVILYVGVVNCRSGPVRVRLCDQTRMHRKGISHPFLLRSVFEQSDPIPVKNVVRSQRVISSQIVLRLSLRA